METMDPAELEAALAATGAIIEELTSTGAFVFAGGLVPPSSAITVDNTGESLSTVNGPFVEAPEYLGGSGSSTSLTRRPLLAGLRGRRRPSAAGSRCGPSRCRPASELSSRVGLPPGAAGRDVFGRAARSARMEGLVC